MRHIARRVPTVKESDGCPVTFVQAETPGRVHDLRPGRGVNVDPVPQPLRLGPFLDLPGIRISPPGVAFAELFTQATKRWISRPKASSPWKRDTSRTMESMPFTTRFAFAGFAYRDRPTGIATPSRR